MQNQAYLLSSKLDFYAFGRNFNMLAVFTDLHQLQSQNPKISE